jgi:hypothetical protein
VNANDPAAPASGHTTAAASSCPHCGHESKTVGEGICADCWAVKDPGHAASRLRKPRTEPVFDWELEWLGIDPAFAYGAVIGAFVAFVVLVVAVWRTLL